MTPAVRLSPGKEVRAVKSTSAWAWRVSHLESPLAPPPHPLFALIHRAELTKSLELNKSLGSDKLTASRQEALTLSASGKLPADNDSRASFGSAGVSRPAAAGRFSLSPQGSSGLLEMSHAQKQERTRRPPARLSLSPQHSSSVSDMAPILVSPRASPVASRKRNALMHATAPRPLEGASATPLDAARPTSAQGRATPTAARRAPALSLGAEALLAQQGAASRDVTGRRMSRRTRMLNASITAAGAVDPHRPFNRRSLHLARLDQTMRQLHEPGVTPASLITQLCDLDLGPEEVRDVLRRRGSSGGSSSSAAAAPFGEEQRSPTPTDDAMAEDTFDAASQDATAEALRRKRASAAHARAARLQRRSSSGVYRAYSAVYHRALEAPFGSSQQKGEEGREEAEEDRPPFAQGAPKADADGLPSLPAWADTRRFETSGNVLWHMLSQVRG